MTDHDVPSATSTVRLVARREIRERLRTRSFWVLTGLLVAAVLAVAVITRLAAGSDDAITVAVVAPVSQSGADAAGSTQADTLGTALRAAADRSGRRAEVRDSVDRLAADRSLRAGRVDVVVDPGARQVVFHGTVDDQEQRIVQAAWSAAAIRSGLRDAGLSDAAIERILEPPPLRTVTLEEDSVPPIASLVGVVSAVLLFIALQTFGGYVLMGVVEEKSTAVIEVLLARTAPDRLLAGKVLGIGVCAAVQMCAAVGSGLVALVVSGRSVPSDIWSAVPMLLVWFVGGYALYSTLFALAGSLVSRQEDAQAASAPIMAVLVAAYVTVFTFGFDPHSTASTVLSMLPPTAPLLMPMRMAAGAASVPEVLGAIVLLLAAILLSWKLTGRIYGAVVLRRGTRISWKAAIAAARNPS